MNILLLTGHTYYLNDYAAFTVPVMKAYCQRHGYDFVCENRMEDWDSSRPYPWSKLLFIKKWLSSNQYDIVVWMDIDIVIMNHDISWKDILQNLPLGDIYIAEESIKEGTGTRKNVNTGIMAFRRSNFSLQLLDIIWNAPNPISSYKWCDQSRFMEIQKRKELSDLEMAKIILCPPRLFNSMLINDTYVEGDFLVHFAGYEVTFKDKQKSNAVKEYVKMTLSKLAKQHLPSLDAYFSHSVVINLDRREDRWKTFQKEAQKIEMSYHRITAIDAKANSIPSYVYEVKRKDVFSPGAWALAKTTQGIVKKGMDAKLDTILIMEDDIAFTDNCQEYLFHAMLEVPNDWEVLLLSQYQIRNPIEIGLNYWQRSRHAYSCAMYVIRNTVFEEYHKFLCQPEKPIDNFIVENIQPRGKCYGLKQSIAYQVSGLSDIDNTGMKKWGKNQNNHNLLLKA